MTSPPLSRTEDRRRIGGTSYAGAVIAGVDAALIAMVFGIMFSLIAYAALGPAALPFALLATVVALVVGGSTTTLASSDLSTITGPTATGALVIASAVRDLQGIPAARGNLDVAVVAAMLIVLAGGVAQILFARLRIGSLLKFVPYPVSMGFTNTVASLLVVTMIPAALGHAYMGHLVEARLWFADVRPTALFVAVAGTAVGWTVLDRWPRAPAAFAALVAATLLHYALASGCATCSAGPTLDMGGQATPALPDIAGAMAIFSMGPSYWRVVLRAALVLAVLSSLFSLLAGAQLTRPKDPPVDGNRLLHALGIGNLCSGALLGLPVAILVSPSRAARQGTAHPVLAMTAYLMAVLLVFGEGYRWFALLPMDAIAAAVFTATRGLFDPATGALVKRAWSGREARRASVGPITVATLVVIVGLVAGLAAALFVGALAAVCLLAIEMRRSVVVAVDDARSRRSRRVRSRADMDSLQSLGDQVRIVTLAHWLYFGTADELGDLLEHQPRVRWLLLDLHAVAGIDVTAARSLIHAAERLQERGMHLVVAGLPEGDARRRPIELFAADTRALPLTLIDGLDAALERAEDDLLAERPASPGVGATAFPGLSDDAARRLEPWLQDVRVAAGDALFRTGEPGDALYTIRHGRLTIWLTQDSGLRKRLLTFGDGGLFGELALLDGRPRSADAVADTDCALWMLTRERLDALAVDDHALHAEVFTAIALQLTQRLRETSRLLDLR